jgi:hypothetical protein
MAFQVVIDSGHADADAAGGGQSGTGLRQEG